MAKDNKTILSSVRFGRDKVFHPGMEDELAKAASAEQIQRLSEKGSITGFTTAKEPEAKTEEVQIIEENEEKLKSKGK